MTVYSGAAKTTECNVREKRRNVSLRAVRYRSIHEIDEKLWDSVNSTLDLFHTHRFIRSIEDARVEDSDFWYLLFFRGERLVGTAVLSAFIVSLDLLAEGVTAKLTGMFKRILPGLLKIKVLFCGLPISIGKNALAITDDGVSAEVLKKLACEMSEISAEHDIKLMCVKEFREGESQTMDMLSQHGFFKASSIPYISMNVPWKNFISYLKAMRHGYRRQVLDNLRKLGHSAQSFGTDTSIGTNAGQAVLAVANPEICPPEKFYRLYLKVMSNTKVKLEILNEAFFNNIYKNMHEDIELLSLVKNNEILGVTLLMAQGKKMTFLLVGLSYPDTDDHDIYQNLLIGIVHRAIHRGCTEIDFGQTSYWSKQRIGGQSEQVFFYLQARNRYIHATLKLLKRLLFHPQKLKSPRVFKSH
jgi:predicted N-acyltransferase